MRGATAHRHAPGRRRRRHLHADAGARAPIGGHHVRVTPSAIPVGKTARRLQWAHLPPTVRALVEDHCGSAVVDAESQDAGFTPGFASVLTCVDGSRHFVKAASVKAQRMFAALLPRGGPQARGAARRRRRRRGCAGARRRRLGRARVRVRRRAAAAPAVAAGRARRLRWPRWPEAADVLTPAPADWSWTASPTEFAPLPALLGAGARDRIPASPARSTRPPRWPAGFAEVTGGETRRAHRRPRRQHPAHRGRRSGRSATGTGRSSAPPGWTPCS